MPKYRITATKTINYEDVVEARNLKEAEALIAEWISEDFSEVDSSARFDIEIIEDASARTDMQED
jgi:hypothetical protein